ncbi:gluconate 2-dehydrogenase subunit 3 family protein [Virgibacillus ainsalahensis]
MTDNKNNENSNAPSNDSNKEQDLSRRKFVKGTGLVLGGLAGGSVLGGFFTNQFNTEPTIEPASDNNQKDYTEARMFITRLEDFKALEQATECIYPEDENGPGAIELGAPYFIDRQLAGEWGVNSKEYMKGPFVQGKNIENYGYQSRLNRGDIFIFGLRKLNEISQNKVEQNFYDAEKEQQIEILTSFENGNVDMVGVKSDIFFSLLRKMTLEGVYSDPLYGGNKDMMGWKMREFPGPRPAYIDVIEEEEFVQMDPISLKDFQQ